MHAVCIKNLKKIYSNGTEALSGIDLQINTGDFFALLGANGAGKTTTIGILTDLVNKTSGAVTVFGKNIDTNIDEIKRTVGVVPQEFNFNIFEKVMDIVVTQAGFFGVPREEAIKRANKILKQLGLWEKKDTVSKALSGGMKRRLMIARALMHNPKLLILDEPTAGVDVELRHSMWEYLKKINQEGTTILLTTHYLEEVEQMCNRMAMIKNGKIVKEGSVKNILRSMENKQFILTVSESKKMHSFKKYHTKIIDENTIEIKIGGKETLTHALSELEKSGIITTDIRPTTNRIEQFFLDILKK